MKSSFLIFLHCKNEFFWNYTDNFQSLHRLSIPYFSFTVFSGHSPLACSRTLLMKRIKSSRIWLQKSSFFPQSKWKIMVWCKSAAHIFYILCSISPENSASLSANFSRGNNIRHNQGTYFNRKHNLLINRLIHEKWEEFTFVDISLQIIAFVCFINIPFLSSIFSYQIGQII